MTTAINNTFLCHRATGKAFVRFLADELRQHELPVWMDERELQLADSLPAEIEEAIRISANMVVCFSGPASPWMVAEMAIAATFETRQIPVLIGAATPEDVVEVLRDRLYCDLRCPGRFDFELPRLVRQLGGDGTCELEWTAERKAQLTAVVARDPAMTAWLTDYATYCVDLRARLETGYVHPCAALDSREHHQFRVDPVERYWAYQLLSEIGTPAALAAIARGAREETEPFARRGVDDALRLAQCIRTQQLQQEGSDVEANAVGTGGSHDDSVQA